MRGLLKITAIGHLGAAPTLSTMPSGDTVANFNLAVTESCKDQTNTWVERTEWLKCHAFGDIADIIGKLCKKGTQVHIEAGHKATQWVDRKGVRNTGYELRIQNILVLSNGKTKEEHTHVQQQSNDVDATGGFVD